MPMINGDYVEYEIPTEIDKKIPSYFYAALAGELFSVYGIEYFIKDEDGDYLFEYSSATFGFYEALQATCRKLDLEWFYEYWRSLPWYDFDMLGDIILDRIKKRFIEKKQETPNDYYKHLIGIN